MNRAILNRCRSVLAESEKKSSGQIKKAVKKKTAKKKTAKKKTAKKK